MMVTLLLRLVSLYKQAPSAMAADDAKKLLLDARQEQDRLAVAGEDISNITRFISEVEYYLYEHLATTD